MNEEEDRRKRKSKTETKTKTKTETKGESEDEDEVEDGGERQKPRRVERSRPVIGAEASRQVPRLLGSLAE